MELRFIDEGTRLDIEVLAHGSRADPVESFKGTFFGMDKGIAFFIACDGLFDRIQQFDANNYLRISFYRGADLYTFTAKLTATHTKNRKNLIMATASSPLEKNSRKTTRIEIALPVNLYQIEPANPKIPGKLVCKGRTLDISSEGICFFSNNAIDDPSGTHFLVEFTLIRPETFLLPVKLMRKGNCPQSVQFKYDYGFLFDFSEGSEDKSNLILSMFKRNMGNF